MLATRAKCECRSFDRRMKNIVTISLVLLFASCATPQSRELSHSHPDPEQVKQALRDIVIPHVAMHNATIHDAVAFLSKASIEHDSKGVSLVLSLSPEVPASSLSEDPFSEPDVYIGPHITIADSRMTYFDLLEEICRQADLVWTITPKCLFITKRKR